MLPFGGPLTGQMLSHILLMSVVAPLAAAAWRWLAVAPGPNGAGRSLSAATTIQLALLWAWHAPPALELALRTHLAHALMTCSLLFAAIWFWGAIFAAHGAHRWRTLFALLVTGKIACLLGILLVFAPRLLYAPAAVASGDDLSGALADQQVAGLLMIIACPLTYVAAGVVIAARWIREMETERPTPPANAVAD